MARVASVVFVISAAIIAWIYHVSTVKDEFRCVNTVGEFRLGLKCKCCVIDFENVVVANGDCGLLMNLLVTRTVLAMREMRRFQCVSELHWPLQ